MRRKNTAQVRRVQVIVAGRTKERERETCWGENEGRVREVTKENTNRAST